MLSIFKQFDWVDLFFLVVLFRICYVSMSVGLVPEFFKFLGTILAIYVSLHYYSALSEMAAGSFVPNGIPIKLLSFVCLILLAWLGYLIFYFLRLVFLKFIKAEAADKLHTWGGLILGVVRGIIFVGFLSYVFAVAPINYFRLSVRESYFGQRLY